MLRIYNKSMEKAMLEFWNDWWWAICLFVLLVGTGGK